MQSFRVVIFWLAAAAHGAINLDGSRAVEPVSADDPSPIADTLAYMPDQHDCPLPCNVDYANVHKWTPYHSVHRLKRCKLPMLLHFSVLLPLENPDTDVLIRSCTIGADPDSAGDRTVINATSIHMDNPKNATNLFEVSTEAAPACAIDGRETNDVLRLIMTGGGRQSSGEIKHLLGGMKEFFDSKENCDRTFLFAWHKEIVAGIHIGPGLGKRSVESALRAVLGRLESGGDSMPNRTVAQICAGGQGPETIFGLSIDTTGNIAAMQRTAVAWSQGECAVVAGDIQPTTEQETLKVQVFDIASAPLTDVGDENRTTTNNTSRGLTGSEKGTAGSRVWSGLLGKRATCRYRRVDPGDGCASLASKCGISGADFTKYNPKQNLCSTLKPGDHVCCSAGDPYTENKPQPPKPNADGSCAVRVIKDDDNCDKLARTFGLTVAEIESFNKGKTWGWTKCEKMLASYNMCLSRGTPPLPPPQQGTQCGPMVPGTTWPDKSVPMTDLNPCPLKACCSNWGFCGPFGVHCDVHAPAGGGPGTKLVEFASTCISNCGNAIKQNSGPPAVFSRIGYYESWNLDRECLWLKAENANTDGSYTHVHWAFADIDPKTWKVVIKDPHKQWQAFKSLPNVKKIISFGGWAYSTEPATYNIIRQAIITNRETFATNAAKFVIDEGIDGIDIDWEYPGAPDIMVDGKPIGQTGDGIAYLKFLTVLKNKLPSKSVSIAAPASYWYLKAFPIDRIAAVIDYIVYMTYDLHGQWDYGNPNAFDSCDSGKCIRSHVNLTETYNSLSIITKAGVPNNKIFVGESSYGRSFRMAIDGCWGPMCEFTGTRLKSNANKGRCTDTAGYISNAEINDIIRAGGGRMFHDHNSNTDVLLYKGDYVSYMTPATKDTRRADWKRLNFAGSIDWAVDLQAFRKEDVEAPVVPPKAGETGCVWGESPDLNADSLCQFSCNYGFCPDSICICILTGPVKPLPKVVSTGEFVAWDEFDMDLHRLCKLACKYGYCPQGTCGVPVVDEWDDGSVDPEDRPTGGLWDAEKNDAENTKQCFLYKTMKNSDISLKHCYSTCRVVVEEAIAEGRVTNYGCIGFWPLDEPIPWTQYPGTTDPDSVYAVGRCSCDNALINTFTEFVLDALPIIAQIGCYMIMSTLKLVLDIGLAAIPGVGRILDAGLDAATTAAQVIAYAYDKGEDPVGAYEWWLSPCGGTDLVPDDIKKVYDILSTVADGVSSFKKPKFKKGSGKKGDAANPKDRAKPKAGTGSGPNGTGNKGVAKQKKCNVPPNKTSVIMGSYKNTLRVQSCVPAAGGATTTTKTDYVITSLAFGAKPTTELRHCKKEWSQACFHYSSAIAQNPQWEVLKCPHGAVRNPETTRPIVKSWYDVHHESWRRPADRAYKGECQADEYPPRYLLADSSPIIKNAGSLGGQLIRYLPDKENGGAAAMWKGVCFAPHIAKMTNAEFLAKWNSGPLSKKNSISKQGPGTTKKEAEVPVDVVPSFKIGSYDHSSNPPRDHGLWDNKCWPRQKAANDPGMTLFSWDLWYKTHSHLYDFSQPYAKGTNGA